MYASQDDRVFELQLLDGAEYVTAYTGKLRELEVNFASFTGKPRRLVIPGKHPARPKYRRQFRKASALDRIEYHSTLAQRDEAVIAEYLRWAKRAGVASVAVYDSGSLVARILAERAGLCVRKVAASDFLGEVHEDAPELMAA